MAYNVNSYFIFLPTVALLYQLVKKERRWWVLLGASVVFFLADQPAAHPLGGGDRREYLQHCGMD